jgi:flavin-binding protein dodecin
MSSSGRIAEIVELVGSSDKSWEETAVKEAVKTMRNIWNRVLDKNC